jgi:hypothetical protein
MLPVRVNIRLLRPKDTPRVLRIVLPERRMLSLVPLRVIKPNRQLVCGFEYLKVSFSIFFCQAMRAVIRARLSRTSIRISERVESQRVYLTLTGSGMNG